ncbi:MAG: glycosyltransferase family 2 protein [Clostridium sp.]|nr:glycosyltransferase family 2 protein [Clostridium sp.]
MRVSIIVPCYNEQEALPIFYEEINGVLESMPCEYEILFINDGSDDHTLDVLKEIAAGNQMVKYISFSRNFGKEAAIYAGFCNVTGDYTAIMDADLQDPPALLPQMLEILKQGDYDSVATRRENRVGEPAVRSWFARWFYRIINRISDADIMDGARDFRLMKKSMVDAIVKMGEYNRFSKGIFGWVGFRTYWLSYENQERVAGETKWNFWKLMRYALEGIIDFSQVPLSIASWFGVIMTACSFIAVIVIIIKKLLFGDPVEGWPSLACIITFIGGVQLFCIGLMGQYIAKAYLEVKKRPHYIIKESNQENIENVN